MVSICDQRRGSHSLCMWSGVKKRSAQEALGALRLDSFCNPCGSFPGSQFYAGSAAMILRPAVDDAMRLVKVHGLGDVGRNDGIVLPDFGDAIHLHGQHNRNAFAPQVAGQQHRRGCSPAVAEENDAGPSFFFRGKNAVVIGVEQAEDGVVGLFPATVLKNPHISIFGNSSLDLLRELNRAVVRVVMADKSAHEADHNVRRSRSAFGPERRHPLAARELRHSREQNRETRRAKREIERTGAYGFLRNQMICSVGGCGKNGRSFTDASAGSRISPAVGQMP